VTAPAYFSPAKLNLFLAITGRRADGFHDLVSVVAPLAWGDTLHVEPAAEEDGSVTLTCDDPAVPVDGTNLVLKAAELFRGATGWRGGGRFHLEKRIPMGAGLGGGSSNGATALRALNELAGRPLASAALAELAGRLGSDCALFLAGGPVVMRGRGECVEALPPAAAARLSGRRVLMFKPAFGIATPWAYGRLAAAAPAGYLPAEEAEGRLAGWLARPEAPVAELLFNNMEPPAFAKFVALPALLDRLRNEFGLAPRMSGSGSACFALLEEDMPAEPVAAAIRAAWGPSALVSDTRLA
jgi:4-diphosphocytidyl-2-C-methyl-D-erythritol kinase